MLLRMSGHEQPLFELIARHSKETLRAILRSTPFVPYGADAKAIQEDIADANSELERLRDEITLAIARVRQLKNLRQPIQSYIKLREAIFAPIHQLPTEILLEIFLIASPSVSITAIAGFPWKLGHVCGHWRDVVLSSPKLWSYIDLGFPNKHISNHRGVQACNVLKLCLTHSGQHPLSIHLWTHKQNKKITRDIVKIALQVRNRWKYLQYTSENLVQTGGSNALLPPTLNLLMLQHLKFAPPRHYRLSIVSPSLESLYLSSYSDLSVQALTQLEACPQITHLALSLGSINPDDFAGTLLQLPELSELNIIGLCQCDSSSIPVHLDHLLILRTSLENSIINNLTTPNLQTLMVDGDFSKASSLESFPGGHIIADLVQRSHCSIFHLILSSYYLEIRDLLGVEIKSASLGYLRDQNKKGNKILVVSVSDRGKRMGNYCTNSGIYTVDYEIIGDRRKMLGKTIKVENVP